MATYLYLHTTLELKRVDWTTHLVWVPKSALTRRRDPQFVGERIAFNHPRYGDHAVYIDKAMLDVANLPRTQVIERVGLLLERQITAERVKVDLWHRRVS